MNKNEIIEISKRPESGTTIRVIGSQRIETKQTYLAFIRKGEYVFVDVEGTLVKIEVVQ